MQITLHLAIIVAGSWEKVVVSLNALLGEEGRTMSRNGVAISCNIELVDSVAGSKS